MHPEVVLRKRTGVKASAQRQRLASDRPALAAPSIAR